MALLGSFIDKRTLASVAKNGGTGTFAHGLPATPDYMFLQENTTAASNVSAIKLVPKADATNVTIYNHGEGDSQALNILSVVFHAIVR
jgi:hypothetical protein